MGGMGRAGRYGIRPARSRDAAGVRECAEQAFARCTARIGRRPAPMDAAFAAVIAAGEVHVAEDLRGSPLGFVAFLSSEESQMFPESAAVLPRAAGQGVGRALIAFCEETARSHGLAAVRLQTNAAMAEPRALYLRLGYVVTGRRTETGFNRVHFIRMLA